MYILIKQALCPGLKKKIGEMIDSGEISTWKFVKEEDKMRLMHTSDAQYDSVVLRFITTYIDGEPYYKILPSVRLNVENVDLAKDKFGVVLGRFSEILNCHFSIISNYKTILIP